MTILRIKKKIKLTFITTIYSKGWFLAEIYIYINRKKKR